MSDNMDGASTGSAESVNYDSTDWLDSVDFTSEGEALSGGDNGDQDQNIEQPAQPGKQEPEAQQQAAQQPAQTGEKTEAPAAPTVDVNAVLERARRATSYTWQSPKQQAAAVPAAGVPGAQAAAPKPQPMQEYQSYADSLKESMLKPLEDAYNRAVARGATADQLQDIVDVYNERNAALAKHLTEKQAEYQQKAIDSAVKERETALSRKENAGLSAENFAKVGKDFGDAESLRALLAGTITEQGYVPGPGAELLEFLYETSGNGDSLEDWFNRFTANEGNLRLVAKIASALDMSTNFEAISTQMRSNWEAEQAQKHTGAMRAPGVRSAPAAPAQQEIDPVSAWLGA